MDNNKQKYEFPCVCITTTAKKENNSSEMTDQEVMIDYILTEIRASEKRIKDFMMNDVKFLSIIISIVVMLVLIGALLKWTT